MRRTLHLHEKCFSKRWYSYLPHCQCIWLPSQDFSRQHWVKWMTSPHCYPKIDPLLLLLFNNSNFRKPDYSVMSRKMTHTSTPVEYSPLQSKPQDSMFRDTMQITMEQLRTVRGNAAAKVLQLYQYPPSCTCTHTVRSWEGIVWYAICSIEGGPPMDSPVSLERHVKGMNGIKRGRANHADSCGTKVWGWGLLFGGFDEALEGLVLYHVLLYVHNALNFREIHLTWLHIFVNFISFFFWMLTRLDQRCWSANYVVRALAIWGLAWPKRKGKLSSPLILSTWSVRKSVTF